MHRGVAKGNEIAGSQEDVVEAGQVDDDDDDPSNCDIHLMAAVAPQMLQLNLHGRAELGFGADIELAPTSEIVQ